MSTDSTKTPKTPKTRVVNTPKQKLAAAKAAVAAAKLQAQKNKPPREPLPACDHCAHTPPGGAKYLTPRLTSRDAHIVLCLSCVALWDKASPALRTEMETAIAVRTGKGAVS